MREASAGCLTTESRKRSGRSPRLTGIARDDYGLNDNLLKLRAVLILLATPWGAKKKTAAILSRELKARRLRSSWRSIYRWQHRYQLDGFAGIVRKRRSDRGSQRNFSEEILEAIVESAGRVRRFGDIRREYCRLKPPVCYETFRAWIHRIEPFFRVTEMAERGGVSGLFF